MEFGCFGAAFEVKFAEDGSPAGSFEGYASVFGNVDSHGDIVEPGAFAKTLIERERSGRALPPMRAMHGLAKWGPAPVGVWEKMSEDANGLYVKGRLSNMDLDAGKEIHGLLRDGALKGLSIGYAVPPGGSKLGNGKPGEPRRWLKMIHLREVSLVDDPSNPLTQSYIVKSAIHEVIGRDQIKSADDLARFIVDHIEIIAPAVATKGWRDAIRDFEGVLLREEAGFSHSAAKAIAAGGFKARPEPRDEDGEALKAFVEDAVKRIRGN